jgi:hypothetical protein
MKELDECIVVLDKGTLSKGIQSFIVDFEEYRKKKYSAFFYSLRQRQSNKEVRCMTRNGDYTTLDRSNRPQHRMRRLHHDTEYPHVV